MPRPACRYKAIKKNEAPLAWVARNTQPKFTSREMCLTLLNAIEMSAV